MLARTGFALVLSLPLLACASNTPSQDEIWKQIEGCDGKELCSTASLATLHLNKQAGRTFSGGVKLRGAKTDGKIVSVGLDVPARIANEPVRNGRTVQQQLGDLLRDAMCGNKDVERFLSIGGEIRTLIYVPSGEKLSENVVRSC